MRHWVALAIWSMFIAWVGFVVRPGYESSGYLAFVRTWGPLVAVWVVGVAAIGLLWLTGRGTAPTRRHVALIILGIVLMAAGSWTWLALVDVPAHASVLSLPNSTLWKILLMAGAASYGVGFVMAWRQAGGLLR